MSDSVPTPPGTSQVASALPQRFVRAMGIAALGVCLSFLGILNVLATALVIGPLVSEHHLASRVVMLLTLGATLVLPLAALIFCNRRGWLRWPQLTALWVLVLANFAYLTWDEPAVRRPLTMDELSPALPSDEATFQIFLRYAKNTPAANAVKPPKLQIGAAMGDMVANPEKWIQYLRNHRAEIEAEWVTLAPIRAWWDELAAQPRIGDLTPPDPASPIIAFQPGRSYSQFAVAIASLQALDGHGDEAMATVTRLYDVARKFEPNSRTLARSMVAKVIQRMAIQAGGFVLDHATVSPASRAALAAEISAAAGGPAGARRLILIEYAYFQPLFSLYIGGAPVADGHGGRLLQQFVHLLGRIVVNPSATQNLVGDHYYQLAALAEERRLGELKATKGPINRDFLGGYHVKNLGGRLFADMAIPGLSSVIKSYWDVEDLRTALLTRLRA